MLSNNNTYIAEPHLSVDWHNLYFAESHHATILLTLHQISVKNVEDIGKSLLVAVK